MQISVLVKLYAIQGASAQLKYKYSEHFSVVFLVLRVWMSVLESYSSIDIWDSSAITLNFSQESGIIKFSRPQLSV